MVYKSHFDENGYNVTVFSFIVKILLHGTKRAGELGAHLYASLTLKTCMKGFVVLFAW